MATGQKQLREADFLAYVGQLLQKNDMRTKRIRKSELVRSFMGYVLDLTLADGSTVVVTVTVTPLARGRSNAKRRGG